MDETLDRVEEAVVSILFKGLEKTIRSFQSVTYTSTTLVKTDIILVELREVRGTYLTETTSSEV